MSRRNNIRGPSSALTDFLRESGITPTTIARRVRTREVEQPEAGPSNTTEEGGEEEAAQENNERDYNSDNLDESEEEKPAKKRKLTKAAAAKQKAQEKAKAKKKAKKGDDEDYMDEDEDAYTALSKMWKDDTRPPIGSLEECAKCHTQFSFTKYTTAANPPPGFLCHKCAKASGIDPFKKPAAPRKRKPAAEKRTVTYFEERRLPSLASLCVEIISLHIDDVEALGEIGNMNVDLISKAIAKNRSLTSHNAALFYDVQNTNLTLYDATNLVPDAFCTMASLNPNLTTLRLDFCGRMDSTVIEHWSKSLPNLQRLELLGPFLVRAPAWQMFFKSHPNLKGFLITQSPRFDLECVKALVENCKDLNELRLKEIGQMSEDFLHELKGLKQLTYLDLSCPGVPEALSDNALIDLMGAIGGGLTYLDLTKNASIGDGFLFQGLKQYARRLQHLVLVETPELTDAGVAEFFDTWQAAAENEEEQPNPPLVSIDFSKNHELSGAALTALLKHSGAGLEELSIHSWKSTPEEILNKIPKMAPSLKKLDIGWCRETNDFVVKKILDGCEHLEELKVWGCGRLTENCPRKRGVTLLGVESHAFV